MCSLSGVRFVRLSPLTTGLAQRRRWREATLDREFALYASRRRLRPGGGSGGAPLSWTGSLLSTPPAADFGPGLEAAEKGCAALTWRLLFYLSLTDPSTCYARSVVPTPSKTVDKALAP